jgi:hypothetical protein
MPAELPVPRNLFDQDQDQDQPRIGIALTNAAAIEDEIKRRAPELDITVKPEPGAAILN